MTRNLSLLPLLLLISYSAVAFGDPATELAEAHGINDWQNVDELQFTFSVAKEPPVSRSWSWNVPEGRVSRTIEGNTAVIELDNISSEADQKIHQQFINDSFWLLFPFSVVWSEPEVTDHGLVSTTIDGSEIELNQVTALWPSDEGYTPGDAYDLFVDEDGTIRGWTFRKGNSEKGRFFVWRDPANLGPIQVYQSYSVGESSDPFIEMKDLQIKLTGEDDWRTIP
ncbi:MAG: hypothetical protein AAGJ81_05955 [Verrucomicrobiota bacterium]